MGKYFLICLQYSQGISVSPTFKSNAMEVLWETVLYIYLKYLLYICGYVTIPRFPWLSALLRLFHLSWLATVVFLMFFWRMSGGDTSVGGLVGTASFLLNGLVNIIIILETIFKSPHNKLISDLQNEIDKLMNTYLNVQVKVNMNYGGISKRLLAILVFQLLCDILKIWINCISNISPVFGLLFPITVGLRTRYVQIIASIMILNRRIEIFRNILMDMAKRNEPKSIYSTDIWQPYDPDDYERVNYMRLIYMRLWEIVMAFNHLYSWSLLMLFMSSFFDIVCNCYWTFTAIYKGQIFHKYVMNGATSFSLISLISVLFYFTDASENNVSA